jgi:FMN reductase (NADPH)
MSEYTSPTIELLAQHRSVRALTDDPVPPAAVEAVVVSAQRAATSSNLQMWSVVAVTDAEKRARLSTLCGNQAHVARAPVVLVWCVDLHRLDVACNLRGYTQVTDYVENFLVGAVDTAIAAQNAVAAAESLGLGACYIGAIRNQPDEVIALLGLPRLTYPLVGLTLGWPAQTPAVKPRLATEAVLHWETYNPDSIDFLLHEYDLRMIASGIYEGRQVPTPGKPGVLEDYGWTEHSARRVSQAYRTGLRESLARQGFDLK